MSCDCQQWLIQTAMTDLENADKANRDRRTKIHEPVLRRRAHALNAAAGELRTRQRNKEHTVSDTLTTATLFGQWPPGSPAWLKAREGRVGGSDIAAILGLSPWDSMFSLYHRRKEMMPQQDEKPEMTWGKRLEPVVVDAFAEAHPEHNILYEPGVVYHHPDRPWQVASPDALLINLAEGVIGGVEVKTDRFDDGFGKAGTDEIPVHYMPQVQWCMDVFGVDTWHVAALFSGSDYREYTVKANPDDQAFMRDRATDFLRRVEQNERPDIDGHSETYVAVRHMHPEISGDDIEIDAELARWYCEAKRQAKAAKEVEQLVTSVLADHLGAAKRARFGGQTIAQRQAKGDGTPYLVAGRNLPTFETTGDAA